MRDGILVACFVKHDDAQKAVRILEKKGLLRTSVLHKDKNGHTEAKDPFLHRRILVFIASLIICLAITACVAYFIRAPISSLPYSPFTEFIAIGLLISILPGAIFLGRRFYGVEVKQINNFSKLLFAEETQLILQAEITKLTTAAQFLREQTSTPITVFVMHPTRERRKKTRDSTASDAKKTYLPRFPEQTKETIAIRNALLKKLKRNRKLIHQICSDLAEASQLHQGTTPVAEWIIDNEYLVVKSIRDVLLNLPTTFYKKLTYLNSPDTEPGVPHIYTLAKQLVHKNEQRLTSENILESLESFQLDSTLSMAELWAFPQFIRIALIESIQGQAIRAQDDLCESQEASFWANRLIVANKSQEDNQVFKVLAELTERHPRPNAYFGTQLVDHLYDEAAVLIPVQIWLERVYGCSLGELIKQEQHRLATAQISIGNAFTSLRQIQQLDWREIFEETNFSEKILRRDPANIYPNMDFKTRDRYRQAVEEIAQRTGLAEEDVARKALTNASGTEPSTEHEIDRHIGSHLIGPMRSTFLQELQCKESFKACLNIWIRKHHTSIYLSLLTLLTLTMTAPVLVFLPETGLAVKMSIIALALFPASSAAIEILNLFMTRILSPDILPKLDFMKTGIPDGFRTLIVIPTLLIDEQSIREEIDKLEIRFMANRDSNLVFSLFTDFTDALEETRPGDNSLVRLAIEGIKKLNQRHGNAFLLFHRERSWCETEQKFIGWERKRGKLEQLNQLLVDGTEEMQRELIHAGDISVLHHIKYVITLDSDTQLPHMSARRLIETISHPLNRPVISAGGKVIRGFTIIQPRVTASLPSSSYSPFSRLFCNTTGLDPYARVVSDVYQDLTHEGTYHGKGIYDVAAFNKILSNRFPEGLILSHDLLEGAHARAGLASDIELFDEFPPDYLSYSSRQHRWIRGDWQIAAWLFPKVPTKDGAWIKNPLRLFDRWKVLDNLRRSLFPIATLGLLTIAWLLDETTAIAVMTLAGVAIFAPLLSQMVNGLVRVRGLRNFSFDDLRHAAVKTCLEIALLPHQATVAFSAIVRTCYRLTISHRKLLEWTTSHVMHYQAKHRRTIFLLSLGSSSIFGIIIFGAIILYQPGTTYTAAPWLILWIFAPGVGWWLTRIPKLPRQREYLPYKDRLFLRTLTRRTWRFFDDFVNEGGHWLPPDNYQVSHQDKLAMRTSPTNIGMWLLSCLGSCDCGYQTPVRVVSLADNTLQTIETLQKFRGHLLNWYDTSTLEPLEPRYVSSVDSGNLLTSLWALAQGLEEFLSSPLLKDNMFYGLTDTMALLEQSVGNDALFVDTVEQLNTHAARWKSVPQDTEEHIAMLNQSEAKLTPVIADICNNASKTGDVFYWGNALATQLREWNDFTRTYLEWLAELAKRPELFSEASDAETQKAFKVCMAQSPTLLEISNGDVEIIKIIQHLSEQAAGRKDVELSHYRRVLDAFAYAKDEAQALCDKIRNLQKRVNVFADNIDMRFLYDSERKLFSIGYNVSAGRLDNSYYDLLASEARLGSYAAIARGDVPMEHWFSMGRSHSIIGGRKMLLSWSGTMFEYLMPNLLQKSFSDSLLDQAIRRAVQVQIRYGSQQKVPWGISESAYGDLDINKTYQYMAFGVPQLGLKRVLKNQLVVAPYATLLATSLSPVEVVANLKRLAKVGLLENYGFYEAIDYSRKPVRDGERGVLVKAYMAHHQGMGFVALLNFLFDNIFQERFHRDPRVKAFELLLQEKIPALPPLKLTSAQDKEPVFAISTESGSTSRTFINPNTYIPKTRLLSNGRFTTMVTNAGSGYSSWLGQELFRWRADRTCETGGNFIYIHDQENGQLWSATFAPVGHKYNDYVADFGLDRVQIDQKVNDIQTKLEITVNPEDDVEIRRLSLFNRSNERRKLSLTSYCELSLALHNADRQHPAFNKLFIRTEALPGEEILVAERRPRGPDPADLFVAHGITSDTSVNEPFQFETDRNRFIGRGKTLVNPLAATGALSNTEGFVLDPVFSLRHQIELEPNQRAQLTFIVSVASTRDAAIALVRKFKETYQVNRSLEFAWQATQVGLRLLHIHHDEARLYQQLANHVIFPSQLLSPPGDLVRENHKGQSGLWPYGISGDIPIVLVTIGDSRDLNLVRQLLQAHSYWKRQGFLADLVIINEEIGTYDQPLREHLIHLIQAYSTAASQEDLGGVFLRSSDEIPDEDLRLLKVSASAYMVAARGPLPQQLAIPKKLPEAPDVITPEKASSENPGQLTPLDLKHFNGYGGFTEDGNEYVIDTDNGEDTPTPWVNVIANPDFGTMVSESGNCFSWFGNSQRNRLSPWSNDPVIDPPGEIIYLRDDETAQFWSPTPSPTPDNGPYRTRHGAGYTLFEHHSHGLLQELLVFVPTGEDYSEPVKLQQLYLRNDTQRNRRISMTYYVELVLGEHAEFSRNHTITVHDRRTNSLFAFNRYHPEYPERVSFITLSPEPDSYSGDRTEFIGRNRSCKAPEAMKYKTLSGRTGERLDPCAVLQVSLNLEPGEEKTIVTMLGQADNQDQAQHIIEKYRKSSNVIDALAETRKWWEDLLGTITVKTPDPLTDILINRWLMYQSLSCRIWGRSALYQSGGAYGYRDQLQDVGAFVALMPELTREQIKLAASRQFVEGDVQHWWHPPSGAGIRSKISDDLLWLPWITAHYARSTGDTELLLEDVPFLSAPLLEEDQHEIFSVPEITIEQASIYEHCRRALEKGLTRGPNGLPLIGTGDWNDGMNLVGAEGRGESVWLGWFLVDVLKGMAEMAAMLDKEEDARDFLKRRQQLIERIEATAWDGGWYFRGTFDDGSLLGSASSNEAQIDSLPQSWAWLTGAADKERATTAIENAWQRLVREDESLIQLFDPPFEKAEPSPGYIKGYPPGVRENGGQYTHAALWFAMAMARKGDAKRAVKMLDLMNPIKLSSDKDRANRYAVEPYVIAADVYRLPGRIGRGGWSWYTGSAAWMYRAWVEEILGIRLRDNYLCIEPKIPDDWHGFSATYRLQSVTYKITVNNSGAKEHTVRSVSLDGKTLDDRRIPLKGHTGTHEVTVNMG